LTSILEAVTTRYLRWSKLRFGEVAILQSSEQFEASFVISFQRVEVFNGLAR
jgi:hypothetical protein